MKKAFLLLAAIGMISVGANAQTQRLNRTNTRNKNNQPVITTVKPADDATVTKNPDGTLDLSRNPGNGANGIDGTINTSETSGNNNSGSFIDQRSNNTTTQPTVTPVPQGTPSTR
jgi:hypothetical protein